MTLSEIRIAALQLAVHQGALDTVAAARVYEAYICEDAKPQSEEAAPLQYAEDHPLHDLQKGIMGWVNGQPAAFE